MAKKPKNGTTIHLTKAQKQAIVTEYFAEFRMKKIPAAKRRAIARAAAKARWSKWRKEQKRLDLEESSASP